MFTLPSSLIFPLPPQIHPTMVVIGNEIDPLVVIYPTGIPLGVQHMEIVGHPIFDLMPSLFVPLETIQLMQELMASMKAQLEALAKNPIKPLAFFASLSSGPRRRRNRRQPRWYVEVLD